MATTKLFSVGGEEVNNTNACAHTHMLAIHHMLVSTPLRQTGQEAGGFVCGSVVGAGRIEVEPCCLFQSMPCLTGVVGTGLLELLLLSRDTVFLLKQGCILG